MKKPEENIPELIKIKEAAKLLHAHPNTLRQWDKKGILKAIRFGVRGDRRYRKEDIIKFREGRDKHEPHDRN